jgi:hypothetical protein
MIQAFSEVRDWQRSTVRFLSWHPHTDKFAVAFRDDTIRVNRSCLTCSTIVTVVCLVESYTGLANNMSER